VQSTKGIGVGGKPTAPKKKLDSEEDTHPRVNLGDLVEKVNSLGHKNAQASGTRKDNAFVKRKKNYPSPGNLPLMEGHLLYGYLKNEPRSSR